ncbi:MAG: hypothetical protein KA714_29895 [Limnoraphis sp. WC205]|jgi:hypothetical protein|nr:hypothetical protein [Limnoraphis sp. WC205]
MKIQGKIEHKGFGTGAWALVTDDKTYELKDAPSDLKKKGLKVEVEGEVREDVFTTAMIGPVLEVKTFEVKE